MVAIAAGPAVFALDLNLLASSHLARPASALFSLNLNFLATGYVERRVAALFALDVDLISGAVSAGSSHYLAPAAFALDLDLAALGVAQVKVTHTRSASFALDLDLLAGSPRVGQGLVRANQASATFALNMDLLVGLAEIIPAVPDPAPALLRPTVGGISTDLSGVEVSLTGSFTLEPPTISSFSAGPAINPLLLPRALLGISTKVDAPAILAGKPVQPQYWLKTDSMAVARQGPTRIRVISDPDPDIEPVPVAFTYRWVASDLALTGDFMNSWPARSGGPSWNSVFPYRPKLRAHQHYGAGPRRHTYSNMVFFNPDFAEHMWLDLGVTIPQPYSWVFIGIILSNPNARYQHWLLDAGKATPVFAIGTDNAVDDKLSTRSALVVDRKSALISTSTKIERSPYVRSRHDYAPRPKMFAGVYNGASSYVAAMDNHSRQIAKGKVAPASIRYLLTGRPQSRVSEQVSADMALLEIRLYSRALTKEQLAVIYTQQAATYRFNNY